ncbi:MAG: diacylglycerol kinase family protein [Candidatus Neomarinimicrobiota bacterium]|nr:diacylglycerol kinase family protein [Candidatus Neomarinimicrobiota bacterium]MED5248112.1 diacylglycerol kinase family protein [Candidatus Neomarinimicrobiota bacterium]
MKKYYLTVNPYGGGKKGPKILKDVLPLFEQKNIELNIIETEYAGHNRDLANQLNMDGYDGFCCIGGDGTLNEVINGLLSRKDRLKFPIGLITGGTGNSFMHDLDCLDPIEAANKIISDKRRFIDVFSCNTNGETFYGFNILGWGIPTDANILADKLRWMGPQRYNFASIIEVLRHKKRFARVIIDNNSIGADFAFIIGCNTIHTGKGMRMAPLARLNDGLIDLIIVRKVSRFKLLKLFPKVFSGKHIGDPGVDYRQVKQFKIMSEDKSQLNLDGEVLGSTPVEVKILPKEVEILI